MTSLRILFVGGYLAYQGLFQWLTKRLVFPTLVVRPVIQMATFTLIGTSLGSQPLAFYAVGNAVHATARAAIFAATISIAAERTNGTLSTVLAAPARPVLIFSGRLIPPLLTGLLSSILMLGLVWGFTDAHMSLGAYGQMTLLIALISASCSALGLTLGSIGLYLRDVFFLPNIVVYAMLLFCGINLSATQTPAAMRVVGDFLPLTHGLRAVRDLLAGRSPATSDWLAELAILAAYAVIAWLLLQVFARRARIDASLDLSA